MTLVDREILEERQKGSIVIEPFVKKLLGTNSYDLRLGQWVAAYKARINDGTRTIDPTSPDVVAEIFTLTSLRENPYTLLPGERVLGHTREFVGGTVAGQAACVAHVHAKSTTARLGLTVCVDAGFGDVGFVNRWALEIANMGPRPILLYENLVLAQVEFQRVGLPRSEYLYGGGKRGSYQTGLDLEAIRSQWRPEAILPKPLKVLK